MGLGAEQDRRRAGECGLVPESPALRHGRHHAAPVLPAPGDRVGRGGHGQRHAEHRAEAGPDHGGVGRIGSAVADDDARQASRVGGAQDRPEVARFLDPLDQKDGAVRRERRRRQARAGEADDADDPFVAGAEGDPLERPRSECDDPRPAVGEHGDPRSDSGRQRLERGRRGAEQPGIDEQVGHRQARRDRAGEFAPAVNEREIVVAPAGRGSQVCHRPQPRVRRAGDRLDPARGHGMHRCVVSG